MANEASSTQHRRSKEEHEAHLAQNERILRATHELYVGGIDRGTSAPAPGSLEDVARELSMKGKDRVLHPLRKVTVMLIGNHSAGKSSFINWYTGDRIQKAGMAVETQGFTFVVHGKKEMIAAPLKGEATIMNFPHIKGIEDIGGERIVEHLCTRVSTKRTNSFPLVQFIDTPGLVDGGVTYPFEVEATMKHLAKFADLIFVFFDTHGTCTVKLTMDVVKLLNDAKLSHKMHYFLSKADTISNQSDLCKITSQMSSSITAFVDNTHGMEIPAIFLPGVHRDSETTQVENQIEHLVDKIDEAITAKVQNNLKLAETHCRSILATMESQLRADLDTKRKMKARSDMGHVLLGAAWIIPSVLFLELIVWMKESLPATVVTSEWVAATYEVIEPMAAPLKGFIPDAIVARMKTYFFLVCAFLLIISMAKFLLGKANVLRRKSLSDSALADMDEHRRGTEQRLAKVHDLQQEYLDYFKADDFDA